MTRIGNTIKFDMPPAIIETAAIAGKKEAQGPLAGDFDRTYEDTTLGTESWEKAEAELQKEAVSLALSKAGLKSGDIDVIFAGDLLNQCISSTFGLLDFNIPFLGQYGACSTMAQTLAMAAIMVESAAANRAVAVTSSHFCSAERQFRLPLEYGGQRTPTAQWTATASGAAVVGRGGNIKIHHAHIGKIVDLGVKDAANMGAAMAPAAANTIYEFLRDTATKPEEYDYIFTGDLGTVGSELLYQSLEDNGIDIRKNHRDCGIMIYDIQEQDVHAGGSGCGCSASVLCGHIIKGLKSGKMKRILFAATGALMSPTSSQQGGSIPGISHLLEIRI